jgi:hypothetical protein
MRLDGMPILNFGFPHVLRLPVLNNGIGSACQPVEIVPQLLERSRGKELCSAAWRVSQRFEQSGTNQNGNVVRSKAKNPRCLFRSRARGHKWLYPYKAC